MRRLFAALMIALGVVAAVFGVSFVFFLRTSSPSAEPQTVVVEKGTTVSKIVEVLHAKGVVSRPSLFKAYVLLMQAAPKIRAGEYVFAPGLTPPEVLAQLLKGDFSTRRITIPEGWSVKEIAKSLAAQGLVSEERFLEKARNLEGTLYPDTYEIYKPRDEGEVLKRFTDRFEEVWNKEFAARAAFVGMSRQEVVTLASIVEKETAKADERPLIASVFLNRLRRGMPLATDPSVIYGISNFDGNLTKRHLSTPGPYNTYLNVGLPPTPIANPGEDAIRAVLYPATTEYLYFVSKNDGSHYFSKTQEEHTAAVRKYQIERRRP
ncbi:MAG TPA: endolytic transglycosylase MltG [bacterium]|nr:endolytic transglycosylase MltG [bacterium]